MSAKCLGKWRLIRYQSTLQVVVNLELPGLVMPTLGTKHLLAAPLPYNLPFSAN